MMGLLLAGTCAFGRDKTVSGVVSCAETGRLLKNVQVGWFGSDQVVLTDVHGAFELPWQESGQLVFDQPGFMVYDTRVPEPVNDLRVKLRPRKLSAASHRMRLYVESEQAYNRTIFKPDPEWQFAFREMELAGDFAPDPGMVRRDPSAVIRVGDLYYVWYTRGERHAAPPEQKVYPWDLCEIWYATSADGRVWTEKGRAVERGPAGAFDGRSVFTPEVLAHGGRYYLVYQTVQDTYDERTRNFVGMAVATSPDGPWKKLKDPILRTTPNGRWADDSGRRIASYPGAFDSLKVHDPCLLFYRNKFYLYYKGQRVGEHRFYGQREIQWGVAIADKPEGPYVKSVYNPITTSGHEVCVWPCRGGVALIHTRDGPEAKTVQWAPDGINFEIMARLEETPEALGLFRGPGDEPRDGIRWGLCHRYGDGNWRTSWNYITRFDLVP